MRRKIVALAAISTPTRDTFNNVPVHTHTVYAACDDGSMWSWTEGRSEWVELPARIKNTERPTFMPSAFKDNSRDRVLAEHAERTDDLPPFDDEARERLIKGASTLFNDDMPSKSDVGRHAPRGDVGPAKEG